MVTHEVNAVRYKHEMPMMPDEWHWRLVRLWLKGYSARDSRGIAYRAYFAGKYEQIARTFLAHALSNQKSIPFDVARMLGGALADDGASSVRYPDHRKLEFRFRRRGNRRDGIRQADILEKMKLAMAQYKKQEAALLHLKNHFGLSRSEVLKIWGEWNESNKGFVLDFIRQSLPMMDVATHLEVLKQRDSDKGYK